MWFVILVNGFAICYELYKIVEKIYFIINGYDLTELVHLITEYWPTLLLNIDHLFYIIKRQFKIILVFEIIRAMLMVV